MCGWKRGNVVAVVEEVEDFAEQIGERLAHAREEAGQTVDDVMFITQLPRAVIEALEAGDFSIFSSPLYAKSFLGQYSDYLEVDASAWLDALEPSSVIPGGDVLPPLWHATGSRHDVLPQKDTLTGGWKSTLTFVALSGLIVYAAIKGNAYLEKRFAEDPAPSPKFLPGAPETPPAKVPEARPQSGAAESPAPEPATNSRSTYTPAKAIPIEEDEKKPEEEERPPRAILVR